MSALPFVTDADGVRITIRLTPKGGRDAVDGLARDGAGRPLLKARVSAAPDRGAANAALIALLADLWDMPKSHLSLVAGATARMKTVHVAGAPAATLDRLEAWARGMPGATHISAERTSA